MASADAGVAEGLTLSSDFIAEHVPAQQADVLREVAAAGRELEELLHAFVAAGRDKASLDALWSSTLDAKLELPEARPPWRAYAFARELKF
jgi:hypothetical protein